MKKYLIAAALMSAMSFASATAFTSVNSDTNNFTNGSWSFNTIFTVGADNLSVLSLGAYDANKDGFTSGSIQVGIYDAVTNALLASTSVLSSGTLVGDYRYASIANLTLQSGAAYRLVAVSGSDMYNLGASTYGSGLSVTSYGYCMSGTLTACGTGESSAYGMANFQYQVASAVPEPTSIALMGLGVLGFAAARRRKQA